MSDMTIGIIILVGTFVGMLMMGVTAPEIRMQGTPTVKAPRKACCWVEDREETISPTPPEATAKISMAR